MTRLFSLFFLFILSNSVWCQQSMFQGRVELGRDLASFTSHPPVSGTLYLLTGAAGAIRIVSQEPFAAEVEFVEADWVGEAEIRSHQVLLRFEGEGWASQLAVKKPRQDYASLIYPYRKFQVAAVPSDGGFRVIAVPVLF
jgi:hypothetical protein